MMYGKASFDTSRKTSWCIN